MDEVTQEDFLALVISKFSADTKAIEENTSDSSKKTKEWMSNAIAKLTTTFDRLPTLLSPDYGPLVHEQLMELSNSVILKCDKTLQDHKQIFYEILLIHTHKNDDFNQLVHRLNLQNHSKTLMKKGFDRLLLRFSRIIHRKNEEQLLLALKLFNGYLIFFQQTNSFILTNTEMIDQIFNNLLILFELQYPLVCLEETLEWNDMHLCLSKGYWKQTKYILGSHLDEAVNDIMRTLQNQNCLPAIINKVFDRLVSDSNASNELICLLLRILRTKSEIIDENFLIEQILTEFLQDRHWYLEIQPNNKVEFNCQIEELHFNVIHICLVIELISTCSFYLRSNTEQYLFDTVPKVLEKAGNRNILIHSAALHGLEVISKGLSLENVKILIENNVDFISHYIEVRLRRDDIKNCLDMAYALLELYSDYDNIHFIQGLFVKIKDLFQKTALSDESLTAALKITFSLLRKLEMSQKKTQEVKACEEKNEQLNAQHLFDQWTLILNPPEEPAYDPKDSEFDFDKMREEIKNISEENENDSEEIPQDTSETTEETAEHVFLRDLIKTLTEFISSPNTTHKLYSLDAIRHCLGLIDTQHKEFLPTVHLIWSPLATRFKENNLLVVSRTFDLLLLIAQLSKDFIKKRTSTEVMPYILDFLNKSVSENLENTGSFAST